MTHERRMHRALLLTLAACTAGSEDPPASPGVVDLGFAWPSGAAEVLLIEGGGVAGGAAHSAWSSVRWEVTGGTSSVGPTVRTTLPTASWDSALAPALDRPEDAHRQLVELLRTGDAVERLDVHGSWLGLTDLKDTHEALLDQAEALLPTLQEGLRTQEVDALSALSDALFASVADQDDFAAWRSVPWDALDLPSLSGLALPTDGELTQPPRDLPGYGPTTVRTLFDQGRASCHGGTTARDCVTLLQFEQVDDRGRIDVTVSTTWVVEPLTLRPWRLQRHRVELDYVDDVTNTVAEERWEDVDLVLAWE